MMNHDVLKHELDDYEASNGHADPMAAQDLGAIPEMAEYLLADDDTSYPPPKDSYKKLALGGKPRKIEARHLQPGDILISTTENRLSRAIRSETGLPVSHAFMYVGGGEVIEADGRVARTTLAEALENDYYAAAYRVPGLTDADRKGLVAFLDKLAKEKHGEERGAPFDTYGLIAHAVPVYFEQDPNAWYCSESVFGAFEAIKKPLKVSTGKDKKTANYATIKPHESYPGHVLKIENIEYIGHVLVPEYARGSVAAAKAMEEEMALWGASPDDLTPYGAGMGGVGADIEAAIYERYVDDGKEHPPAQGTYKKLAIGGATPIKIEARHLEVGDILVSTSTELLSKTIKEHTNAPVSHAFMYVGNGDVIEADGTVERRPLADALSNDYYAAAYRMPGLTKQDKTDLVKFMEDQRGKPFDEWGMIDHLILVVSEDPNAWYCSELVFAAYEHIKKPLMLSSKKSPQKIAPSDSYPGHVLKVHNIKYVGHVLVPAYARGSISVAKSRGMGGRAMMAPQMVRRGQMLAPPPAASLAAVTGSPWR